MYLIFHSALFGHIAPSLSLFLLLLFHSCSVLSLFLPCLFSLRFCLSLHRFVIKCDKAGYPRKRVSVATHWYEPWCQAGRPSQTQSGLLEITLAAKTTLITLTLLEFLSLPLRICIWYAACECIRAYKMHWKKNPNSTLSVELVLYCLTLLVRNIFGKTVITIGNSECLSDGCWFSGGWIRERWGGGWSGCTVKGGKTPSVPQSLVIPPPIRPTPTQRPDETYIFKTHCCTTCGWNRLSL